MLSTSPKPGRITAWAKTSPLRNTTLPSRTWLIPYSSCFVVNCNSSTWLSNWPLTASKWPTAALEADNLCSASAYAS